ncbi:carnitine acetyl transferase [Marasmius fiardii PR-910]|nr:carnitine acetyl transferase [Marasmius fiardii PR-910]
MTRSTLPHLRSTHPSFKPLFGTPIRHASVPSRPENWKAAAPAANGVTYAHQNSLPKLPVPELQDTLRELKQTLKPIAWNEQEWNETERKVDQFAASQAPTLQERLKDWAKDKDHWLEQWWDDGGYLGYRDSVVVNVSYYYGFHRIPQIESNAHLAAALVRGTMLFRQSLKRGELKPEGTKEGFFCMDTYRWMFDCTRIPGAEGLDYSISYAAVGDDGTQDAHVVVFRRNRPWKVYTAKDGRILSLDEIQRQIQHIYDSDNGTEYPGVGVLASSNRDVWAKDYATLSESTHNSSILHTIQSSAFTVSLDTGKPHDSIMFSRYLWHGELTNDESKLKNRWVDKPCQFIVFDNGRAGFMGEHSVMDGTPTVRLCDEVCDWVKAEGLAVGRLDSSKTIRPEPLDWEINPGISKAIDSANQAAMELTGGQTMTFHETSYGKSAIKKFGVSPDSWAQMIVQLAYKRLLNSMPEAGKEGEPHLINKREGGTYEAATTRLFYKGRTETIRVISSESDAWVASMDQGNATAEERKKLFKAAADKHIERAKMSGKGQGIDRHLLGLKKVLKDGEAVPELFQDPVFNRSSTWVLSTSAVFSKWFGVYGWGEVVPNGFGVAYMTGYDDKLVYTITSRKGMPNTQFIEEVKRAATDLYELFSQVEKKSKL